MFEEYLFGLALNVLLATIKRPTRVKTLQRELRKLRDALVVLDLGD